MRSGKTLKYVFSDNHGQNILVKFTKIIKIGVSLEYFTVDSLNFSRTTTEIWLLVCLLGIWYQF